MSSVSGYQFLELSSQAFKYGNEYTGFSSFNSSPTYQQHKVYEILWKRHNKPLDDLEYGNHAFHDCYGKYSTLHEKASVIDEYLDSCKQRIVEAECKGLTHMVGHVVVGGGHFIERGGGLVQQLVPHMAPVFKSGPAILVRTPSFSGDYWNPRVHSYGTNVGYGIYLANSESESRAYENFRESDIGRHVIELGRETALLGGSLMAGDFEGAFDHAAKGSQIYVEGMLKDFGFNGGWDYQRLGTMSLPGDSKD